MDKEFIMDKELNNQHDVVFSANQTFWNKYNKKILIARRMLWRNWKWKDYSCGWVITLPLLFLVLLSSWSISSKKQSHLPGFPSTLPWCTPSESGPGPGAPRSGQRWRFCRFPCDAWRGEGALVISDKEEGRRSNSNFNDPQLGLIFILTLLSVV